MEPNHLETDGARDDFVVLADPDPESRGFLRDALIAAGLEVRPAATASEAFDAVRESGARLVITELLLPDVTGLGLCRMLRDHRELESVRIVLVTSFASEVDRVVAFEAGVDDLVTKPYSVRELAARARAILRRRPGVASSEDPQDTDNARSIEWSSAPTPIERRILQELVQSGGRVVSRAELLSRIWGGLGSPSDRVIDAHVKAIRRKLGESRTCVETVRGVGYRFLDSAS